MAVEGVRREAARRGGLGEGEFPQPEAILRKGKGKQGAKRPPEGTGRGPFRRASLRARGNGEVSPPEAFPRKGREEQLLWRTPGEGRGGAAEPLLGERAVRATHAHPTLSEVLKEAALNVDKRAIHG